MTTGHTQVWRPLGPRIAAAVAGASVLIVMTLLWIGWDDSTRASVSGLQRFTVVAMFGLGFACLYGLARSRVEAHDDAVVVVNGYRKRRFEWAEVFAVRLNPGAPWAIIDLTDGTTCSAMGIQGSDGVRARAAIKELRRLLAVHGSA